MIRLLALSLTLAFASGLCAQEWVSLFNGKDLAGWNKVGKEKWV